MPLFLEHVFRTVVDLIVPMGPTIVPIVGSGIADVVTVITSRCGINGFFVIIFFATNFGSVLLDPE